MHPSNSKRLADPNDFLPVPMLWEELCPSSSSHRKGRESDQACVEEREMYEVCKNVCSILDKLTLQNFQTSVNQILTIKINSIQKLDKAIDLIFEKAVDEPGLSMTCARICRELSDIFKTPLTERHTVDGKQVSSLVTFRKILLRKCQNQFYKDISDKQNLEEARNKDFKKDGEWGFLQEEQDLKEIVNCKKMQGNIRFIGELFKLMMISENIMHNCIIHLFQIKLNEMNSKSIEDQLECLCTLLATIGKKLDHKKAKPRIDQYFDQIQKIILKIKLSSRIKSALQDIIKLRANNWVPTVDDKEAETDQAPLPNSMPHVFSTLEELYKCPVCLEIFENPYTLPCQHPLCKECLDSLVHVDGGMTIKCPLCNAVHLLDKDISCLKAPLTMTQTVECLKANRSYTQAKHICEAAGCKRAIVTYCVNSKTYLCKPCKNNDDYNIAQGHLLPDAQRYQSMKYSMNLDMVAPFCHLHESFETRCCSTCNELCCIYCYVSKHNDHNVVLLNEYNTHNFRINYEDKIEELQSMKTNLENKKIVSQSYIVDLNSDADAMKKVIKLNTNKIIAEFAAKANEFEVQLLNALVSHQAKQCGLLSKSIYENNCDVAKLLSVIEEVDRYKKKSEMERFYHYSEMKDTIDNTYQEQALGNKSDKGPLKPIFEVCYPSDDNDLVLAALKDKFEFIKVSTAVNSTGSFMLKIPANDRLQKMKKEEDEY